MNLLKHTVFAATFLSLSLAASAQWIWLDKNGRKVFSDQPPSAQISQQSIIKQPDESSVVVTPAPQAKASSPRITGRDPSLLAKKKQAEEEEETQRKAQLEKIEAAKALNCQLAKQGLSALQGGTRLTAPNAKGEIEPMSDQARTAEIHRLQSTVSSDCK